jgi:hypothetical protein
VKLKKDCYVAIRQESDGIDTNELPAPKALFLHHEKGFLNPVFKRLTSPYP